MKLKTFLKNPLVATVILTGLFITGFSVSPYSSIASAIGLTVMLMWVNMQGIKKISLKFKKKQNTK